MIAQTVMAYRVHATELEQGALVPSSIRFAPESDALRTAIEDAISERRPAGKPDRRGAIFVFEAQDVALEFALKHKGSRLYRVAVQQTDILHRADWTWLDEAKRFRDEPARWGEFADAYWAGKDSVAPVIEWMVREARVESELAIITWAKV